MNFPQIGRLLQWSSLCAINMIAKLNLPWLVFWNHIHACIHIVINSHGIQPSIVSQVQRPSVSNVPLYIFFMGEFPDFWDWLCGLWCPAYTRVARCPCMHRLFPFAFPYLGVFPFTLLHLPLNFIVSSL